MTSRQTLKKKNLAAFKESLPDFHARLHKHRPRSRLVFDATGAPDVKVGGKAVYGGDADRFARDQVEKFVGWPMHLVLPAPEAGDLDSHANRFIGGLLSRAEEAGIAFAPKPPSHESYFLVVFGVGLGLHVDALVDAFKAHYVIFVEPDFDFLHHSLETCDWGTVFEALKARGGAASFLIDDRPRFLADKLREVMLHINYAGVDGTTCFTHRYTELAQETLAAFMAEAGLYLRSIGFFYDETLMLRNAYGNLSSGEARVFQRPKDGRVGMPVFVVASGPSLDDAIPFLRDNAGNAVVVSCGTTLRPLMVNGIVPDFQVETENINVYMSAAELAKEADLKPVSLLAASTVDQNITVLFGQTLYFFRPHLSPFPLFCEGDENCLRHPDPGVINAGLSFALDSGFRDIFLFGADLGVRDPGRHHAKDHHLYTARVVEGDTDPRAYELNVPGNFGGEVFTSRDFVHTRAVLEEAIRECGRGRRIRNCSDGVLIAGATPTAAEKISLSLIAGGKEDAVARFIERFPLYPKDRFDKAWDQDAIMKAVRGIAAIFRRELDAAGPLRDKAYVPRLLNLFRANLMPEAEAAENVQHAVRLMYRGSVYYMVMAAEYYLNRVAREDSQPSMEAIVLEELAAAMTRLRDAAEDILADPTKVPKPLSVDDPDADEAIAEVPITWGEVRRNDPCPCGSGRKFKHCHGKAA